MSKIVGIIGKRYCLYRSDGDLVLFDKIQKCFVESFCINKEKAEIVLRMDSEEARLAANEL